MVRILLIAMLGLALSVPQGLMMGDAYSKSDTGGANKGSGKGKADKGGSKQGADGSKGAAGQKAGGQSKSKRFKRQQVGLQCRDFRRRSQREIQKRRISIGGTSGSRPGQCGQASFWWFRFGNARTPTSSRRP